MSRREAVIYGIHAALAVAAHRPYAIRRVLHHRSRRQILGPLLKAAAAQRRPYREVAAEDLERVAKTLHHEGVVVIADPLPLVPLSQLMANRPRDAVFVAMDTVQNPHNLGAIIRSAAWFGAAGILFPAQDGQAGLSAAALRIAQGGAEVVPCCGVGDLPGALQVLKGAGIRIVGADQRGTPGPIPRPTCVVLGAEQTGLSDPVRAVLDAAVAIPGTGAVESLNVAVAAGILLSRAFQA